MWSQLNGVQEKEQQIMTKQDYQLRLELLADKMYRAVTNLNIDKNQRPTWQSFNHTDWLVGLEIRKASDLKNL
jgi:hypothetical protein